MYIYKLGRYASGVELLLLHGIPVSAHISETMGCAQVHVSHVSHRTQCKLAGNSMHATCIGLMFMAALGFTEC